MSLGALGAGAVGLVLLAFIRIAGAVAGNSRSLLVVLFRPGLYLTAMVLIGLILVHAAVAMAAIYYGESALVGRIHVGIIAAIGLGAAAGVFAMARGAFKAWPMTKVVRLEASRGRRLTAGECKDGRRTWHCPVSSYSCSSDRCRVSYEILAWPSFKVILWPPLSFSFSSAGNLTLTWNAQSQTTVLGLNVIALILAGVLSEHLARHRTVVHRYRRSRAARPPAGMNEQEAAREKRP